MEELTKIVFNIDPETWHGYKTETVWAESISPDIFRIRNVPFYVQQISAEDEVMTEYRDGNYHFKFVTKRGGHSTYRIFLEQNVTAGIFRKYWQHLESIGCTYEKGRGRLFAIDVPPSTDIYHAYKLLEEGEKNNIWEFEEGHCGHSISSKPNPT